MTCVVCFRGNIIGIICMFDLAMKLVSIDIQKSSLDKEQEICHNPDK